MATTREHIDKEFEEIDSLIEGAGVDEPTTHDVVPDENLQEQTKPVQPAEDENSASYESQVFLFKKRVEDAYAENRVLKAQLEEMRQQRTQISPPQEPVKSEYDDLYEQEVEDLGEAAAKRLRADRERTAKLEAKLQALESVAKKVQAIEGQQAVTAEERFFTQLSAKVPEWKKINGWKSDGLNQDPEFSSFLDKPVPFQDYTYNEFLNHHYSSGNVDKVAEIFTAFQNTKASPVPQKEKRVTGLESLIEPDRGRGTPPPDNTQKKIFTEEEVKDFDHKYMLWQAGKVNADPAKMNALWDEVYAAKDEGRIRKGATQ